MAAASEEAVAGVKLGVVSDTVADQRSRPRVLLPGDVPPGYAVRIR